MELEIIKVDMSSITKAFADPDVYVISKHRLWDGMEIRQIKDTSIKEILSEKNLIVRIKNK